MSTTLAKWRLNWHVRHPNQVIKFYLKILLEFGNPNPDYLYTCACFVNLSPFCKTKLWQIFVANDDYPVLCICILFLTSWYCSALRRPVIPVPVAILTSLGRREGTFYRATDTQRDRQTPSFISIDYNLHGSAHWIRDAWFYSWYSLIMVISFCV